MKQNFRAEIVISDWYVVQEIGNDIFWIKEPGHVSFFVFRHGKEGLLIDSGLGLNADKIRALFAYLGISKFRVLCTHSHCDHIGWHHHASKIYISKIEWEKFVRLQESQQLSAYYSILKNEKNWPSEYNLEAKDKWTPNNFVQEGNIIEFGRWKFQTYETPGHTSGSLIFHEQTENKLFLGDLVYSGDLYLHLKDSSFRQYEDSIAKLIALTKHTGCSLWPSHNKIPLDSGFVYDVQSALLKIKSRLIGPTKTWPKDSIFEEGLIFNIDKVCIVAKADDINSYQQESFHEK